MVCKPKYSRLWWSRPRRSRSFASPLPSWRWRWSYSGRPELLPSWIRERWLVTFDSAIETARTDRRNANCDTSVVSPASPRKKLRTHAHTPPETVLTPSRAQDLFFDCCLFSRFLSFFYSYRLRRHVARLDSDDGAFLHTHTNNYLTPTMSLWWQHCSITLRRVSNDVFWTLKKICFFK